MFFASTLVLVAATDYHRIQHLYSEVISHALYNTMNNGSLDIMVMKSSGSLFAIERITAGFYAIAHKENESLRRRNITITVLLDGRNIELSRKQSWEVIVAGKYGMFYLIFLSYYFFFWGLKHFITNQ